ncbi:hypothetical protein TraAM80_07173 [Trypanosoma rangeli]|uniref:RNA-editing substrate-binding complex 6 protein domain-containing protein n=1 Tax=Trypanosoma rangeli TaxID=5698 RepID=A0A422N6R4_TRYRA|nr:uncharacterized protein TraAM80_07173 [Trypanosoma rangeli]RNF01174.1 hypothetical protein TraAM80_07173 [Trypanosoma rangeli]|eukprot:RNF01174.1 hypothetical protein TraAM80_07173 [Trypanosoma rangeli]
MVSPLLATRLTKEELCLSMAALSRLRLRQEELLDLSPDSIVTRTQRVIHLCNPTELGMLSDGAAALFCNRVDMADTLICALYAAMGKGAVMRLDHVTAVVRYAATLRSYSSETVPAIITSAPRLLHKKDSASALQPFLQLARKYLSEKEFGSVVEELRRRAVGEQVKCIHEVCLLPLVEAGPQNEAEEEADGVEEDDDNKIVWTSQRARSWMSQRLRKGGTWSPDEVVQAMEFYSHFGVQDPVLQRRIDEAAVSVMPAVRKVDMEEMLKVVVTSFHLFPQTAEFVRQHRNKSSETHQNGTDSGIGSASSLTRHFRTTEAYERLLAGRHIPEEWMLDVMQEQGAALPVDVVAQAACIFAEKGEIPEVIILQLSTQLKELSPEGVASFFRVIRRDSSGALLLHGVALVSQFVKKGVREATVETLLRICAACSLPLPRGINAKEKDAFAEAQARLAEAIIARLISVMQGSCTIPFLCNIAKSTSAIDANNELGQFVCLSVCAQACLTMDEALELLDMLRCRNYLHEPLLDKMEPLFRELVQLVVTKIEVGKEVPYAEARGVARFIVLQAIFDAPDFEASAALLLHTVEQCMNHTPSEVLPAAGLLALKQRRMATVHTILEKATGKLSTLSEEALDALAQLLSQPSLNSPGKDLVSELVAVLAERLAQKRDFQPDCVGLAVAAHCQYGDAEAGIQASVAEHLLEWMGALSAGVYAALCGAVHLSRARDAVANALIDDFPRRLDQLTTSEIARVAFGLGEIDGVGQRLSHQLVAEKCSDYVVDHSHEFWSGNDIARLLYGFSRMLCTKRSLYNVFATRLALRPILLPMDQKAITLVVAAFGRAKYLDKALFDKFALRMLDHSDTLAAPDLMLAIRGFSRVMLLNRQLYNELGSKAAEKADEFPFDSKCALLASFGSLGIEHEKLATRALEGIVENMAELGSANKAVEIIVSLWQMNHDIEDDACVVQLANWIAERSEELTGDAIGKLCVVLNESNWRHVPLLQAMAEQSVRLQLQQGVSADCCRAVLDTLGTFMIHHQGARENLSALGRSVSKERIQLSEEEEQQVQLLLRR